MSKNTPKHPRIFKKDSSAIQNALLSFLKIFSIFQYSLLTISAIYGIIYTTNRTYGRNEMTTINIKCTSKMSKGLQLNGNKLTGDTYNMRSYIKDVWGGRWDGSDKSWIVDPEVVISTIEEKGWGFCKVLEIVKEIPAELETRKTDMQRGIWQVNGELTEDY